MSPGLPAPISMHGVTVLRCQPQQGQRHTDFVVEIALRGQGRTASARIAASMFLTEVLPLLPVMPTRVPSKRSRLSAPNWPRASSVSHLQLRQVHIHGQVDQGCAGARLRPPRR